MSNIKVYKKKKVKEKERMLIEHPSGKAVVISVADKQVYPDVASAKKALAENSYKEEKAKRNNPKRPARKAPNINRKLH